MRFEQSMSKAVAALKNGRLVCLPTDTLFALSCDATNEQAVNGLYYTKRRDKEKKLPVFFSALNHVEQHCYMPASAKRLASKFWPGKLTMVLKLREDSNITREACDCSSIAVRVPNCATVLEMIGLLGKPIIGTSANISGHENPHSLDEVAKQFRGEQVMLFSCSRSTNQMCGTQSTIVAFDKNNILILREGAITRDEIIRHI